MSVLKRIRRIPDRVVPISDAALKTWLGTVENRKDAQKKEALAKAKLLTELGTAEAGETSDGQIVTYFEQKTGGLLTKELRQAHPDIAAQFTNLATHRVLRLKKT
jgi:hypothetical protein